jgi:CheY-like chemotaxis protein
MRYAKPLLLVEDNPDDAMIIQRAVAQLGLSEKMVHAPSAEQALVHLRSATKDKPALILLDLNMSGMSGIEFLQTLKSDPGLAAIPVVVLTISNERRDILRSFDLHAAGYIVKPSDYETAVKTLKIIEDYWSLSHLPAAHA